MFISWKGAEKAWLWRGHRSPSWRIWNRAVQTCEGKKSKLGGIAKCKMLCEETCVDPEKGGGLGSSCSEDRGWVVRHCTGQGENSAFSESEVESHWEISIRLILLYFSKIALAIVLRMLRRGGQRDTNQTNTQSGGERWRWLDGMARAGAGGQGGFLVYCRRNTLLWGKCRVRKRRNRLQQLEKWSNVLMQKRRFEKKNQE